MKLRVYTSRPDIYILGIALEKDNNSIVFGVCFFKIAITLEIVW